jgi:hypothetical protein
MPHALTLRDLLLELGDRQAQLTPLSTGALQGGPFEGGFPLRADERLGNRVFLVTPAALPRLRPYLRDVG